MSSLISNLALPEDFISGYANRQPKWGFDGLGYIIYLRTYARKKADGTLESWYETVRRITEGNFKVEAQRLEEIGKWNIMEFDRLMHKMKQTYHLVFNLVMTPPGRGLWMSGTKYAELVGDAENNCWGISMQPNDYHMEDGIVSPLAKAGKKMVSFAPVFTFDQAMKGGGVGVNVQAKYVSKIPHVTNKLNLTFVCEPEHPDYESELRAAGVLDDIEAHIESRHYFVPDSRQGWATALAYVIDAHYEGLQDLVIDLSGIRERGAEIKGFGGIASGPAPLVKMLSTVNDIINKRVGGHVSPTEWGDVIQNIGCCVVAGNVRRTALILIGDESDKEYIESKNYSLEKNLVASQWRWASNNSIDISSHTPRESLKGVAVNIYFNGEPGYVNIELSRNFGRIIDGFQKDIDANVVVFNPCGEITLPDGSPCNLFEINLPRVHELIASGQEGPELYQLVAELAAEYAYRVTFRPYEWKITRDVVYRDRRLGVGTTGVTDWVLMKFGERAILGFKEDGEPIFNPDVCQALDELYGFVKQANVAHAELLDAEPSIKVTTIKPSGTVSLLMGVSPGQHFHWSKWMIRRVRMSANAPLVQILRDCGYHVEFAIKGFNADGSYQYDMTTVVVEFPVKAPTADHPNFQSAGDVPLKEQAALQALLASYWSDNAVSATLSFHKAPPRPVFFADGTQLLDKFGNPELRPNPKEEDAIVEEITDVLDRYKTVIKSTSLLPYAAGTYPQMPYESISEERYNAIAARVVAKPWEIQDGGFGDLGDLDSSGECVGGACPIR